jgi:hypothetical protein
MRKSSLRCEMGFEGRNLRQKISVLGKPKAKLLAGTFLSKRRFSAEKHVRRKLERFSG